MCALYINDQALVTPVGGDVSQTWQSLREGRTRFGIYHGYCAAKIFPDVEEKLLSLSKEKRLRDSDRAVRLGLIAAQALRVDRGSGVGVVFGSSRGATHKLELEHSRFLKQGRVSVKASPQTTGATFATTISRELELDGPSFFVSAACATSLQAIAVGASLVAQGQLEAVVAGGSEASVTPFTLNQLDSVGVYSKTQEKAYPYCPFSRSSAGIIVGEGAGAVLISRKRRCSNDVALLGFGGASEKASLTGITKDGEALQLAMRRALDQSGLYASDIDLIVAHGAGTALGDRAEQMAYSIFFGQRAPIITFNKWLTGHMLGAAGVSSLILALTHMREKVVPACPYPQSISSARTYSELPSDAHVMVVALGFGGNAAVAILGR